MHLLACSHGPTPRWIRCAPNRMHDTSMDCTTDFIEEQSPDHVQAWLRNGSFDPGEVADPEPGTCEGLMKSSVWRTWSTSEYSGTMVIIGDSGLCPVCHYSFCVNVRHRIWEICLR